MYMVTGWKGSLHPRILTPPFLLSRVPENLMNVDLSAHSGTFCLQSQDDLGSVDSV